MLASVLDSPCLMKGGTTPYFRHGRNSPLASATSHPYISCKGIESPPCRHNASAPAPSAYRKTRTLHPIAQYVNPEVQETGSESWTVSKRTRKPYLPIGTSTYPIPDWKT